MYKKLKIALPTHPRSTDSEAWVGEGLAILKTIDDVPDEGRLLHISMRAIHRHKQWEDYISALQTLFPSVKKFETNRSANLVEFWHKLDDG